MRRVHMRAKMNAGACVSHWHVLPRPWIRFSQVQVRDRRARWEERVRSSGKYRGWSWFLHSSRRAEGWAVVAKPVVEALSIEYTRFDYVALRRHSAHIVPMLFRERVILGLWTRCRGWKQVYRFSERREGHGSQGRCDGRCRGRDKWHPSAVIKILLKETRALLLVHYTRT